MDYNEVMRKRVSDIEARIGEILSEGRTAKVMIGSDRTMNEFLEFYCGGEPNWREPVFISFVPEDKQTDDDLIRVLRSIDIKYGEIIIL